MGRSDSLNKKDSIRMKGMEAGDGIEPSHGAFAEPGLTTWLPRRHHFND